MYSLALRGGRPPAWAGVLAVVGSVALGTALVYPLRSIAPAVSLGVVYLIGVVLVSTYWGFWFGIATTVVSAGAFNFFHIPPTGRFEIADGRNWVSVVAFSVVALATSSVSEAARARALEAERRRAEADLSADMARLLLAGGRVERALGTIGRRLSQALELPSATIELRELAGDARHEAIPLMAGATRLGTVLVPHGLPERTSQRLRTVVLPALAAVLTAALDRERLLGEVVETESLRRSDVVKTAVLRAVSHDLRSPVTAMVAAADALRAAELNDEERDELAAIVVEEGDRLSRLIENLLDLSRIEAGAAAPHARECAVDELVEAARAEQPDRALFQVEVEDDLPLVSADFGQLQRALANLLDNAARYAGGKPVAVRARRSADRVAIRVTDHGPGLAPAEQERVFQAFYRAPGAAGGRHDGSGLGLAIARGFVEANGGELTVESVRDQGTTFVIELPVAIAPAPVAAP
jgi:two-component system sensor histidine kinase KdpD